MLSCLTSSNLGLFVVFYNSHQRKSIVAGGGFNARPPERMPS
jgi:hypothetical protein